FLHVGFAHLIANTVPFLVLGWIIMARSLKDFWLVLLISTLVSGLGVWLTAPPNTVHLGASGVIFGFLGFLLMRGYFERSAKSIVIALLVGFFFGSALWGVLPLQSGVSWQGHLFGFVGGGIAARLLSDRRKTA
ncbi:MAG: rhomboid family intramembrane serine protease, partial [Gemmatimonadaceae bacterium]|nr:rhomboid family intramembrane serine protease [Gloeobacterales cyanobacterium ES-bin-141]